MNTLEFAREIERANRRMVELRRAARGADAEWIETALAELSSALEELKVAEEELVSQNEELAVAHAQGEYERHRYRELFMSSPYGQVVTDLRGVIAEANRVAADMLGVPVAALTGKPLPLMVVLADRDRFSRWIAVLKDASHDATVCAECGGSATFKLQTPSRTRVFPCEMVASPLADRFGRIDTIRWCFTDVSEREQAKEVDTLREEARRKDEFLAVLGHELRNPLAAISLAADILVSAGDSDRRRWAGEVVGRHADQLRRLVDDLLDVSRVSHGKISLRPEAVDLRHVVAAAVESCQPLLQAKAHELAVRLPDQPAMLHGDPTRLTQIVANLVDNAAKYTPSGGRIEVSVGAGDGTVVVTIKDTGIGIAGDMLQRIFGPYQQADGTGKSREDGLGLGLSLVRELVAMHGGEVQAHSAGPGKGASFTVELPAGPAGRAAAERPATADLDAHRSLNGHRVLIVDDNADAAALLAERLRVSGYSVEVAFDGNGGITVGRQGHCHVALVDLGLPDMDGFEVCRTLKREVPSLRVVALTGYSDATSRERAVEAGFERFLVKPLDVRQVLSTVSELLPPRSS
jgi:PAS domain S-box-containing protein